MANECGIIMVELEAKENVMGPLLATANEAIDSTKSLGVDEMEIGTRYVQIWLESKSSLARISVVLENLIDREKETREKWEGLNATVNTWKDDIYSRLEKANKLDDNLKILNDLMENASEQDLEAGEVFAKEVENIIATNKPPPSKTSFFDTDVTWF